MGEGGDDWGLGTPRDQAAHWCAVCSVTHTGEKIPNRTPDSGPKINNILRIFYSIAQTLLSPMFHESRR